MKTTAQSSSEKELKTIHIDTLEWKSNLQFIENEIQFINQLLNSYVFEPTTPNLFERLQEYKKQIVDTEEEILKMKEGIRKHENQLGGMLECDTISCDNSYYQEHELMKMSYDQLFKNFRKLKSEIFGYAGGILKQRKNNTNT